MVIAIHIKMPTLLRMTFVSRVGLFLHCQLYLKCALGVPGKLLLLTIDIHDKSGLGSSAKVL